MILFKTFLTSPYLSNAFAPSSEIMGVRDLIPDLQTSNKYKHSKNNLKVNNLFII
jgi:hypothetical protein